LCRRVLGNAFAAEDALQATFLVLARKAGRLRPGSLAGWLYRVAYRVAQRARAAQRPLGRPSSSNPPGAGSDLLDELSAREFLRELASGASGAWLTGEARAALGRLGRR
jgi:DNA-directed RNA polymerase specialized sigma24 family protein